MVSHIRGPERRLQAYYWGNIAIALTDGRIGSSLGGYPIMS